MRHYTLTVIDTAGIQDYIYASNRLQEIIGASQLVHEATHDQVYQALDHVAPGAHNLADVHSGQLDRARRIEVGDRVQAELIYSGGGNTALLFQTRDLAVNFARRLTRSLLEEAAPGLDVIVHHVDVAWPDEGESAPGLADRVEFALTELARRKQARRVSTPLLGLGVTAACESSGLPAVGTNARLKFANEPIRLISREIAAKLAARERADTRLKNEFAGLQADYKFPAQIDFLGRELGEESYVAVVHADGNNMGQWVRHIGDAYRTAGHNRQYIEAMRAFSSSVATASRTALQGLVRTLVAYANRPRDNGTAALPMQGDWLPFRPLIFGGDDVTLVCNGRLGLSLAAQYLRAFERQPVSVAGQDQTAHACAGVCIVKMHYPFSRAAALADELTRSAKNEMVRRPGEDISALDWHFAPSGLSGSLETIRQREYTVEAGRLMLRPVRLHAPPHAQDARNWESIASLLSIFQDTSLSGEWFDARNKVKALRDSLRAGPGRVEEFRRAQRPPAALPAPVPELAFYQQTGWHSGVCGYFDAIELMDHYMPLSEEVAS